MQEQKTTIDSQSSNRLKSFNVLKGNNSASNLLAHIKVANKDNDGHLNNLQLLNLKQKDDASHITSTSDRWGSIILPLPKRFIQPVKWDLSKHRWKWLDKVANEAPANTEIPLETPEKINEKRWIKGEIKVINNKKGKTFIYQNMENPYEMPWISNKINRNTFEIYLNNATIGNIKTNWLGNKYEWLTLQKSENMKIVYSINILGIIGPLRLKVSTRDKVFINKMPVYSKMYKCYVWNYKERKIDPCTKNIQWIDENDEDTIYLQWGKSAKNDNSFIWDYKYPFTAEQAWGIGVTCLLNKLLCE